jgi:hypothetical protein
MKAGEKLRRRGQREEMAAIDPGNGVTRQVLAGQIRSLNVA